MRPLIGITAYRRNNPRNGWEYDVSYAKNAQAIRQAGGLPVLIPAEMDIETIRGIYERVDGVLLPGGGDIDPSRYNATERHPKLVEISERRDEAEISMARWAVEDDRPVFGICRGLQVMNVALGGTLTQDIHSSLETDLRHDIDSKKEPRSKLLHDVTVESGSRLAGILGETVLSVNSLHHQSIHQPSPQVRITAHAPDGIAEALEIPDCYFAMAVQWHPEDLISDDERMRRLFAAFVEAARERMPHQ